jgi:hypothetical protein
MENPSRERGSCFHADATDERLERGREGESVL